MAFKVQVGPAQITIHQGQTVLVTGARRAGELAQRARASIASGFTWARDEWKAT